MTLSPPVGRTAALVDEQIERRARHTHILVGALLTLGFALRIWILAGRLGVIDSDEALAMLIGRWTLRGDIHTVYWGQNYGGTLFPWVVGAVMSVVGVNRFAVAIPVLMLDVAALALVWRIGTRFLSARGAVFAALAFWLWPAPFVWFGTRAQAFYLSTLVLGVCAVVCAQRAVEGRTALRDWSLAGLCAGLGFWQSPNIVYFVVPVVAWLLLRQRGRRVRELFPRVLVAVPWAILGALPWIVFNVAHPLEAFSSTQAHNEGTYLDHLHYFFFYGLPLALGLRTPMVGEWVVETGHILVYGAALALVVIGLLVLLRCDLAWAALALVAFPFLFALIPFGSNLAFGRYIGNGRYLFFLWPILPLVLAAAARRRVIAVVVALSMAALSTYGFVKLYDYRYGVGGGPLTNELIDGLDALGVDAVYAPYWVAYRITFESGERIIAIQSDIAWPYPPYRRTVHADPHPAWVFYRGGDADAWVARNKARGIPMRKVRAGGYDIVVPTTRALPPPIDPPGPRR